MKIHIKSQHEGKHTLSPESNVQKQFQKENAPKKDNFKGDNVKQGEMVQIDRNEYENLQDLLVQSGQENENSKCTIREWIDKTDNMSNEIETQKIQLILMEEENAKLFNEKSNFKEDSENAFKRSK